MAATKPNQTSTSPLHLPAVFPVAGMGTRFLPATKCTPKEMLPIVDKPLIQYAAEEAVAAGSESLIFITNRTKHTISDHFDSAYELEDRLQRAGKLDLLERVQNTLPVATSRLYVPQDSPQGLGHAVAMARAAVGAQFFAVLLADDLILPDLLQDREQGCLAQMLEVHRQTGASVVAVQQVPREHIHRYGVVAVDDFNDNFARIRSIVEKPSAEQAPSDLGVVGRYILAPAIFDLIAQVKPDQRGEIQLTDAIAMLLQQQPVYACRFTGTRHDCGHQAGFVQATLDVAMRNPELRDALLPMLRQLLDSV